MKLRNSAAFAASGIVLDVIFGFAPNMTRKFIIPLYHPFLGQERLISASPTPDGSVLAARSWSEEQGICWNFPQLLQRVVTDLPPLYLTSCLRTRCLVCSWELSSLNSVHV